MKCSKCIGFWSKIYKKKLCRSFWRSTRAIFFQGRIGREIRTTVKIRWSFDQMCCAMSLVCPSIATHRTCQFWARSESVNMPKTIVPAKCGVRAVIRFIYLEQATRNVALRYCPSWQCKLTIRAIVWYAIHLNFTFSSAFLKDHKCRSWGSLVVRGS